MWDICKNAEPKGFIKEFKTFILDGIPTSEDWAETIARTTLAAVCGNMRITTQIGPLKLNQWNLIIGPSGMAYKTSPMIYCAIPVLLETSEMLKRKILMPSRFTVEGMIEYLSTAREEELARKRGDNNPPANPADPNVNEDEENSGELKNCTEGIVIRDEFSSFFKDMKKEYASDTLEFLSELYDGTVQRRFTRKTKLEEVDKVYMNMLSATTPYVYQLLEKGFFIQGTGNRMLYTLHEPGAAPLVNPDTYFVPNQMAEAREQKKMEFAGYLAGIYNSNIKHIIPDKESSKLFIDFKTECDTIAMRAYKRDPKNLDYTYLQRLPMNVLKIASVAAISRSYKTVANSVNSQLDGIILDEPDMVYAISRGQKHFDYFQTLARKWITDPKSRQVETSDAELNYLSDFVMETPDHMLTQTELLQKSKYVKNHKFEDLIGTLIRNETLAELTNEEIKGLSPELKQFHNINEKGRPPIIYKYIKKPDY